jgi:DNA repair protein RecO (recombination protein O)
MICQDKGFLLSINKYNENSAITEFYTENYGKITGVIFGSTSKKIKSYLLIGNKFHLNFKDNHENKLGHFKAEIDQVLTPIFLENKKKLYCIIYAMNLINILTVNNQENKNIYNLINIFFEILNDNNWIINFIFWELKIFKNIGYDIDFKDYVKKTFIDGDEKFVIETNKKIIPNFLINHESLPKNNNEILNGFKIVGDFLDKTILKPNNINYPVSRFEFTNLIK